MSGFGERVEHDTGFLSGTDERIDEPKLYRVILH